MTRTAVHPGLYDPNQDTPNLMGTQCDACSTRFFPPLGIGCEVCGSEHLAAITMPTTGTVHSTTTVHLYTGKDIEAPFTMAEISLDDGPLIRATLTDVTEDDVIGARVRGEWFTMEKDDDGNDRVEPRFRIIEDGA
jgi:uncharacterized OB-fold protein